MSQKFPPEARQIMDERFHRDSLISLATADGTVPSVRTVNAFYEDGSFYIITYALSGKIKQIEKNPNVAVCGDWFTAHGIGENLGHIRAAENTEIAERLRRAFSDWYGNGHTNEDDPNTVILRVRLTDGMLMSHGTRYEIDFRG